MKTSAKSAHHIRNGVHRLPSPSAEETALSSALTEWIKKQLTRKQLTHHAPMTFSDFMSHALYTPELGYYANDKIKFGQQGDFITAPEVSPLFGASIARQSAEVLLRLTKGSILELGAGSGALAIAMLNAFDDMGILPEGYVILEPSAGLQALQKERLSSQLPTHLMEKVSWVTELPQQFVGVMVANEVLDALPVEIIRIHPNDSQQGYVIWSEEKQSFAFDWQVISDSDLQDIANQLHRHLGTPPNTGYTTEVSRYLFPWMKSLADSLQQGGVLLLDYGYTRKEYWSPQRWMGSLRAYYRQRVHQDVFWQVGLQDITASVDFTAVAEAGHRAGLVLAGYTTQANFLLSLGILDLVDPHADVLTQLSIAQQIKTLTLPDEMGETFKAMAFLKGIEGALTGFSMRDLRNHL